MEIIGTTNATVDTATKFRHGKNQVPWLIVRQEGDVYIPRSGIGPNDVDIRSRTASTPFRVILFFQG